MIVDCGCACCERAGETIQKLQWYLKLLCEQDRNGRLVPKKVAKLNALLLDLEARNALLVDEIYELKSTGE